jgi:hypothetical protein
MSAAAGETMTLDDVRTFTLDGVVWKVQDTGKLSGNPGRQYRVIMFTCGDRARTGLISASKQLKDLSDADLELVFALGEGW